MCVFRCSAARFDVDEFLASSPWTPLVVKHRGRKTTPGSARASTKSGFNVLASNAGRDDRYGQIRGASRWLARHAMEIRRARRAAGKDALVLDFWWDFKRKTSASFLRLPLSLVRRAAALGVALEVSVYRCTR
jgi:hypothetical protein